MVRKLSFIIVFALFSITSCTTNNPTSPGGGGSSPQSMWLVVLNNLSGMISYLDLEKDSLYVDVIGTGQVPNDLIVISDKLLVINSTSHNLVTYSKTDSGIIVCDNIEIGATTNPFSLCSNESKVYTSCFNSDEVVVLAVTPLQIIKRIDVGRAPEGLLYYDGFVYVACTAYDPLTYSYGDGYIYKIDCNSDSVIDSLHVGTNPQYIIEVDNMLHISCTGDWGVTVNGRIYSVNTTNFTVSDSILIEGTPLDLCYNGNDTIYVAAGGWVGSGEIYSYTSAGNIIHGTSNPIQAPLGVMDVELYEDRLFATCFNDDSLVELEGDSVIRSWSVGDGPQEMVIW